MLWWIVKKPVRKKKYNNMFEYIDTCNEQYISLRHTKLRAVICRSSRHPHWAIKWLRSANGTRNMSSRKQIHQFYALFYTRSKIRDPAKKKSVKRIQFNWPFLDVHKRYNGPVMMWKSFLDTGLCLLFIFLIERKVKSIHI